MLDKNKHYIIYCNSGRRSGAAAYLLGEEGYNTSALEGGISSCSLTDQSLFNHHEVSGGL
jgi:rhodanese-related sulfurtransferase